MTMTEDRKQELLNWKKEHHEEYLASSRRRYHERMKNKKYVKKMREKGKKYYASLTPEKYEKYKERSIAYYNKHKNDKEFMEKKRRQQKEYAARKPDLARKRRMKCNLNKHPGYTNSRGIKIKFRPSGLEYRFYATFKGFFYESKEYHDFSKLRKAALKEFGI